MQISQLKERLEGANSRSAQAKKEAEMLKESLELKEREAATMKKRMQASEDNEKKLIKEIEDLRTKLLNKDKENNKIVEEQRTRLEVIFRVILENIQLSAGESQRRPCKCSQIRTPQSLRA